MSTAAGYAAQPNEVLFSDLFLVRPLSAVLGHAQVVVGTEMTPSERLSSVFFYRDFFRSEENVLVRGACIPAAASLDCGDRAVLPSTDACASSVAEARLSVLAEHEAAASTATVRDAATVGIDSHRTVSSASPVKSDVGNSLGGGALGAPQHTATDIDKLLACVPQQRMKRYAFGRRLDVDSLLACRPQQRMRRYVPALQV